MKNTGEKMIEIRKNGIFFIKNGGGFEIDDSEMLSFLKEPIREIDSDLKIKDFIYFFVKYNSLFLIQPDFLEVVEASKKYVEYEEREFEKVSMFINSEIKVVDLNQYSQMAFHVQAVCYLSNSFAFSFPAFEVSLKDIINSRLEISPKMQFQIEIQDNELRSQVPFDISQFTLFDFISTISSMLIMNTVIDNDPQKDVLFEKRNEVLKLKERIEIEMKARREEKNIDIEKETNSVIEEINNLLNKKD